MADTTGITVLVVMGTVFVVWAAIVAGLIATIIGRFLWEMIKWVWEK